MGVGDACGRWHWGLSLSSLWGQETCEGELKLVRGTRVDGGTGAFGGGSTLHGAKQRVRGCAE
eukprot:5933283-Pyramimonas_sp.AAC.1